MSTKVKFKVSDKLVKARDGASYDIKNYTEGVDYVMRGCFNGQKAVFRSDILGVSVVDPSLVEHKQEPASAQRATLELDEKGMRIVFPEREPSPQDWRPQTPQPVKHDEPVIKQDVQLCKIKRVYPNFKWVETDKGRVWVGLKGQTMKAGMTIKVKNGELYLGKTESSSMTRI